MLGGSGEGSSPRAEAAAQASGAKRERVSTEPKGRLDALSVGRSPDTLGGRVWGWFLPHTPATWRMPSPPEGGRGVGGFYSCPAGRLTRRSRTIWHKLCSKYSFYFALANYFVLAKLIYSSLLSRISFIFVLVYSFTNANLSPFHM